MKWTADVARGDWIATRLSGWGVVGGTVPRGFEAYVRVFHPVEVDRVLSREPRIETEERATTWREIAERFGTTWHPLMQWDSIAPAPTSQFDIGGGWRLSNPTVGRLDLGTLATLAGFLEFATTTPDDVIAGVWHGWGELRPSSAGIFLSSTASSFDRAEAEAAARQKLVDDVDPDVVRAADGGPTLHLPGREYVLLETSTRELSDRAWIDTAGLGGGYGRDLTPNVLWPEDRAWFLTTEIDFDSTLIGGSRQLIDAVLATSALESAEVGPDASLASDADTINPPPPLD